MVPLTQWACDSCGNFITDPELGLVAWTNTGPDDSYRPNQFTVVHKNVGGYRCDPGDEAGFTSSLDINTLTGAEGQARLLAMLSPGPIIGASRGVADLDAFTDLFRRMQTEWYEEARPHFSDEATMDYLDGANETLPYLPDVLRRIAEGTLGR